MAGEALKCKLWFTSALKTSTLNWTHAETGSQSRDAGDGLQANPQETIGHQLLGKCVLCRPLLKVLLTKFNCFFMFLGCTAWKDIFYTSLSC